MIKEDILYFIPIENPTTNLFIGSLLMRNILLAINLFMLSIMANTVFAEDHKMLLNNTTTSYGNLTLEGPTGMFLNPTSSTLKEKQFIVQYCVALLKFNNTSVPDHYAIASYGIRDWLEFGVTGRVWDLNDRAHNNTPSGAGPFARVRLLKEENLTPEFSVGAISVQGDPIVRKDTLFAAVSKGLGLRGKNLPLDVRLHAGVRQFWLGSGDKPARTWFNMTPDAGGSGINDHVAYFGGEMALPKNLYIVSEVSTMPEGAFKTPYSVGAQLRSPDGYGLSLAAIQTGNQVNPGIMIGVGINFN